MIQEGILNRIDDNTAGLAISKDALNNELDFLTDDQKYVVLPILQQSQDRTKSILDMVATFLVNDVRECVVS